MWSYRIFFLLVVQRCANEHVAVLAVNYVAEAAIRDVMLSIVWSEGLGIQSIWVTRLTEESQVLYTLVT